MKRKRGYTLIELVAVMAILAILLGSGLTMVGILKKMKGKIELESAVYEVSSILGYAKSYCRKNLYEGEIVIDAVKNSIMFRYKTEGNRKVLVQSKKIPNSLKISFKNSKANIDISSMGYLKDSGTILISDGVNTGIITIAVGNDLITIK